MKKLFVSLLLISISFGYAQENLNKFKYIIVPKKFDAFKKENQYKTSTIVKYLFSQKGFNTVYDDTLPEDLRNNRCMGLVVSVDDQSSMFTTKTGLVLKDCNSQTILSTALGSSKKKEYEVAYREALNDAFSTIQALNYKYAPEHVVNESRTTSANNNLESMEEKQHPKNKVDAVVVKQEATPENQLYKSTEPVIYKTEKAASVEDEPNVPEKGDLNILYAQKIANGYQLVDSTPKIRLKLYGTSVQDVYVVKHDKDNGLVYKKDGKWYLEYYLGETLQTEELNIKF